MEASAYSSVNPSNEQRIAENPCLSEGELERVVARAWSAHRNWRERSIRERLGPIARLKDEGEKAVEALAAVASREMGKVITESRAEAKRLATFCEVALERAETVFRPHRIEGSGRDAMSVLEPLGVVFAITPWNAPLATPLRNIIPAIVAGNSVILKPAPNVAESAKAVVELFEKCGFPEGLVSLGILSNALAEKLIADPRIRKVAFTGSSAVGARLASIAGANVKPVVLELGGSDPCLVLQDADVEKAAGDLAASRCSNAGQICCAPKRIIVERPIYQKFRDAFVSAMGQQHADDPFSEKATLGPMARADLRKNLSSQVDKFVANGARVLLDGGTDENRKGYFFQPMVLEESASKSLSRDEELFGPVGVLLAADSEEDAVEIANSSKYGLGATVYTGNAAAAERAAHRLEAGFVHVNSRPGLNPYIPFGGVKASGFGRDCGDAGFLEYTSLKSIIRS